MLHCRGIRGATTADANTPDAILSATRELLALMVESNAVQVEDITSAFFTLSEDLNAVYPAFAARQLGWEEVALLCAREIPVPDAQDRCVRVLLHVNTEKRLEQICHVYLRDAVQLRPTRAYAPVATATTSHQGEDR